MEAVKNFNLLWTFPISLTYNKVFRTSVWKPNSCM